MGTSASLVLRHDWRCKCSAQRLVSRFGVMLALVGCGIPIDRPDGGSDGAAVADARNGDTDLVGDLDASDDGGRTDGNVDTSDAASGDGPRGCVGGHRVLVPTFTSSGTFPVTGFVESVATADFDEDGKTDVVTATDDGVDVLLGNGDGTLRAAVKYGSGRTSSVATADFNGDHNADIVVTNFVLDTIAIFLGKGDGTFQVGVTYPADQHPSALTTADFNRDGKLDIAVVPTNSYVVAIFLGRGDGTFQPPIKHDTLSARYDVFSAMPSFVTSGDLNNDTIPDVVISNGGNGSAAIFLGNGDGTLNDAVVYAVSNGSAGAQAVVGDWNRDGKSDLAATGMGVAVLLGRGDGTLQPATAFDAAIYSSGITAGDWNGDGDTDLVLLHAYGWITLLGNGHGAFQPVTNSVSESVSGSAVANADLNGDGQPDLIVNAPFSSQGSFLKVLLGSTASQEGGVYTCIPETGSGPGATDGGSGAGGPICGPDGGSATSSQLTFAAVRESRVSPHPSATSPGDFDHDGKMDVAVATDDGVSILLGNGDGTFRSQAKYSSGAFSSVATADFNHDGKVDVAAAILYGGMMRVFLGNGDGSFQAPLDISLGPGGFETRSVNVADFDGDGRVDLAVAHGGYSSVDVLLANGDGTFKAPVTYYTASNASYVTSGDLDNNGTMDMVVAGFGTNGISVFLGNGDGTFQKVVAYGTGNDSGMVVVGDWNGDRVADLAVSGRIGSTGGGVGILIGNGDGTFQPAFNYEPMRGTTGIATGDWNGDGKADLAVGGDGLRVLLGDGAGGFEVTAIYGIHDTLVGSVAVADWNGDGRSDIGVPAPTFDAFDVYLGRGGGTFQAGANQSVGAAGTPSHPAAITTGDWNSDGKIDLATADYSVAGTVTVLLGNGNGTFRSATQYAVGVYPADIVAGDWNGDGVADLAVSNSYSSTISVLIGKGDGAFGTAVAYPCMSWPASLVTADFNGDGKADLAAASSNGITVLLGKGDGTFQNGTSFDLGDAFGNVLDGLVTGDWNHDGRIDIAVSRYYSGNIEVRLGTGTGVFLLPRSYWAGTATRSLTTGDWNGDGNGDLASVNWAQDPSTKVEYGSVHTFRGNGDGTFYDFGSSSPQDLRPLDQIATADWNGDGKADLAVTDAATHQVKIHLGIGDGTFQSAVPFTAGRQPSSLAGRDLNGDGLPDLILGDGANANITVLLNISRVCAAAGQ